jgi:hypothetical protein
MLMRLSTSILRVITEHKKAEAGESMGTLGTVITVTGIS